MKRAALYTAFAITSAATGALLNWAEGISVGIWNQVTWAIGLLTGLILGSLAERHLWRDQ